MKIIRQIFFFVLACTMIETSAQNQLNVTEYMVYQPLLNPASIASYNTLNGALLYRKQWVGLDGAPESGYLSINSPLGTTNLFTGGTVIRETIGANTRLKATLNLAYRLRLSPKNNLSFALDGGVDYTQSDYNGLYFNDTDDPEFTTTNIPTITLPSIGFSSYFFSSKYYVGIAVPTFFRHANSIHKETILDVENLHYYFNAGYGFTLSKSFVLTTSTLLKAVTGAPLQYDFNAQLSYMNRIALGVNYRSSKDVSVISTIHFSDNIGVSYAFDFGLSSISNYTRNTHEVMVLFEMPYKDRLRIATPRF